MAGAEEQDSWASPSMMWRALRVCRPQPSRGFWPAAPRLHLRPRVEFEVSLKDLGIDPIE